MARRLNMSVVAVKITDAEICFAADSQATRGNIVIPCSFSKIKKINNGVVCGVGDMGWVKQIQVYAEFIQTLPVDPEIDMMYRWVFDFYKWQEANKTPLADDVFAAYIIGTGSKVFHIEYGSVTEVVEFLAMGAGGDIAMAALSLGTTVEQAVDLCCRLNPYCSLPIVKITLERNKKCEKELCAVGNESADAFLAGIINENL